MTQFKDVYIRVRMDWELKAKLQKLAAKTGTPISFIVRKLIEGWIKKHK